VAFHYASFCELGCVYLRNDFPILVLRKVSLVTVASFRCLFRGGVAIRDFLDWAREEGEAKPNTHWKATAAGTFRALNLYFRQVLIFTGKVPIRDSRSPVPLTPSALGEGA
jgi:hypothetical protein